MLGKQDMINFLNSEARQQMNAQRYLKLAPVNMKIICTKSVWVFIGIFALLISSYLLRSVIFRECEKTDAHHKNIYLETRFSDYFDSSFRLRAEKYDDVDISNMVKNLFELWLQHDDHIFRERVASLHVFKDPDKLEAVNQKLSDLDPLRLRHLGPLEIVVQGDSFFVLGRDREGRILRLYSLMYVIDSRLKEQNYDRISKEFSNQLITAAGKK
jgi:hypothetical protein